MQIRIARSRDDYLRALRLVYTAYRQRGYAPPHPSGIRFGPHYAYRTTRTFIAEVSPGHLVGTVSVVGDSPAGLPLELIYPDEVRRLRAGRRRPVEATGFAISTAVPGQRACVFFALTRFLLQYCYWCRYDDLVIAVHPVQVPFYQGVLGFEIFGSCRPHPLVQGAPSVALRLDLRTAHCRVPSHVFRKYIYPPIPTRYFLAPPMSDRDRRYFCTLYYGRPGWTSAPYEPPQRAA